MDDLNIEATSSFDWSTVYWIIGIAVVVIVFIYFMWRLKRLMTRPETVGFTREELAKRWVMVRQMGAQNVMGAKVAVMEADTLLDSALKSLMMPGNTLGERLKTACYKYPKLRDVWWAHKVRNQLAHESSFQLTTREAKQALDEYEKAFKTLNLM